MSSNLELIVLYMLTFMLSIQVYTHREKILVYESSKSVLLAIVTINVILFSGIVALCLR